MDVLIKAAAALLEYIVMLSDVGLWMCPWGGLGDNHTSSILKPLTCLFVRVSNLESIGGHAGIIHVNTITFPHQTHSHVLGNGQRNGIKFVKRKHRVLFHIQPET